MHTKALIVATTIGVYLMSLVAFSQHQAIAQTRYQRSFLHQASSWELSSLISGVSDVGDTKVEIPEWKPETVAEATPVDFDPVLCEVIGEFNRDIGTQDCQQLAALIEGTANMYGVDPYLVAALVSQESAFRETAISPVGALGLGQLMPETARDLGVNPYDPRQNLDGCVRYLAQNLDRWASSEDPIALALASYNAGPGAVQKFGGIPPYEETINYVTVIKYRYSVLRERSVG